MLKAASRGFLALASLVLAGVAHADTFDINVGSDAVRGGLTGPLGRVFSGANGLYDIGIIHAEDDGKPEINNLHAGFLLTGDTGARDAHITAGLGLRVQYLDLEHGDDGTGLALGGQIEIAPRGMERISFGGYGYYQPKILTSGDIDAQSEWAARIGYEVIRNASIYVGYRSLRADYHGDWRTLDSGGHVGLRLDF